MINIYYYLFPFLSQISKNAGTVTFTHFGRILKFLGILLASEEFGLLVKRFAKDAYTINYVAFLKAIDEVQSYFDKHQMLALGGVNILWILISALLFIITKD